MSRGGAALFVLVGLLGSDAAGNGRPAETSSIHFGPDGTVAAGMTFGLVVSEDGGATWRWSCEDALGYGGEYDPAFAYASDGALFSTSFAGLMRTADHCTVTPSTPLGAKFVATLARGPDNALFAALAEPPDPATMSPGDTAIYKSTDDGQTFPISAAPSGIGTAWYSVVVAPSDPTRVYLAGSRVELGVRVLKLFRSTDGGASYQPMGTTGLTTSPSSALLIAGVSAQDPDLLYARVTYQDNAPNSDAIFRSVDAGATWTKVFARATSLSALVRANGDVVVANRYAEAWVSRAPSSGDAWETLAGVPHVNCLVEHAGVVWACTQNYAPSDETRDGAGIMTSADLATWTPALRFQDIAGPIACPPGTTQRDVCADDTLRWCTMRSQFGIVANPTSCPELVDGPLVTDDAAIMKPPGSGGCCDANAGSSIGGAWLFLLLVWQRSRRSR
ncbi:MAG: WD40/YVTN/BNR-like repeat-containing protein [Kofleriaceae bacterium]